MQNLVSKGFVTLLAPHGMADGLVLELPLGSAASQQPQPGCSSSKKLCSWLFGAIYGQILKLIHISWDHLRKASIQICFNEISKYTDIQYRSGYNIKIYADNHPSLFLVAVVHH